MARIVVFDSGLGSLSIIRAIQKKTKCEIIYFADEKNFPYGGKSVGILKKIILKNIKSLDEIFRPDLIVMASNTPTLLLRGVIQKNKKLIGVLPPLKEAKLLSHKTICVLATKSVVSSRSFQEYLRNNSTKSKKIISINASPLVELVESGNTRKKLCTNIIHQTLHKQFLKHNVDVATLSSTHLPFLLPYLKVLFPDISFIHPADLIADTVSIRLRKKQSKRNKLCVYTSGDSLDFEKKLSKLKIKHKVKQLLI